MLGTLVPLPNATMLLQQFSSSHYCHQSGSPLIAGHPLLLALSTTATIFIFTIVNSTISVPPPHHHHVPNHSMVEDIGLRVLLSALPIAEMVLGADFSEIAT